MTTRKFSQKMINEQIEKQNKRTEKIDEIMKSAVNHMTDEELRQRYNLPIDEYDKLFNDGIHDDLKLPDELKSVDCHLDIIKKYDYRSKTMYCAVNKLHKIISYFEPDD